MNHKPDRGMVFKLIIVMALVAPFAGGAAFVAYRHQLMQSQLDDLVPRHARLQGLRERTPQLLAAAQTAALDVNRYFYPVSIDAVRAGNEAQQRIRSAFEGGDLAIVSAQVQDPKDSEGFQRIKLTLLVEGSLGDIQNALLKLKSQNPVVLTESISVQPQGQPKASSNVRVTCSLNFVVLRAKT